METMGWYAVRAPWGQGQTWEWNWGMHPLGWAWGAGGLLMMLMMLVFWGAVIAAIVAGIRWFMDQGHGRAADSAMEILRQRYARGEINREEFEQKKRDLGGP